MIRSAAVWFMCLTGAAAQQLPVGFEKLSLEQRWLEYLEASKDPQQHVALLQQLADLRDHELLEWIAIYDHKETFGTAPPVAAKHLAVNQAPEWLRVAAWFGRHSKSRAVQLPGAGGLPAQQPGTHSQEDAITLLLQQPALFLGWYEKHADELPFLKWVAEAVRDKNVLPEKVGDRYPGPIDPEIAILAWLVAPRDIGELQRGVQPEEGKRYLHQVSRAVRGLIGSGIREPAYMIQLEQLTRHPNATLRREAYLAFSKIEPQHIPFARFERVVRNSKADDEDRALAMMAASYSDHPAAFLLMHELLPQANHPANGVAITRLTESGFGPTLAAMERLEDLGDSYGDAAARLRRKRREQRPHEVAGKIRRIVERAGWAKLTREDEFVNRTVEYLRGLRGETRQLVLPLVKDLTESYVPRDGLVPDKDRLQDAVRAVAREAAEVR